MKRFALLALSFIFPSAIMAAPAVVTTGEHSNFTRIVVTLPAPNNWRLGRVADGYTLSVELQGLEYDLTGAFKRIPKTRIADIQQVPATSDLHIVAACACHVTAFAFRPNVIVVDIKAGDPPAESVFEAPLVSFTPPTSAPATPTVTITPEAGAIALDWAERIGGPVGGTKPVQSPVSRIPQGFRETIVEQLGLAASQGLVSLDTTKSSVDEKPARPLMPPVQMPEASFRVIPEAGMEMRLGGVSDDTPVLQEECLPLEAVDLPSWGKTDDNPAETLSAIHRMLVTDADRLPDAQLADAARQYLYLGFGVEARLVLAAIPEPTRQQLALAEIGLIIDGGASGNSPFRNMETCNNASALWAVLARDRLRPSEPIAAGAVVQAFAALPYHLRETLGARLIDRLLERGDEASAHMVRDTISRVTEQVPLSMQLSEARLDLREDRPEQAKAALQAASAHPGPDEAAALVGLINMDFAARNPVTADRIAMLETLIAQNRGQKVEQDLRRALVLAYALSGEFDLAYLALQQVPVAAGEFWSLMAESGADADILEHAFVPPIDRAGIDAESTFALARKLNELGFPGQALQWLNVPRDDIATFPDAIRMTIAQAQLALFQPKEALETISGLDHQADHLRAQAMRALGRSDEAAALLQGNSEHAGDLAFLQRTERQWAAVAAQGEGAWPGVAALAIEDEQRPLLQESVTLGGASAIATKAEESRKLLDALLQETQINSVPP
ncbi:MAG TPA: hypothetical protein PLH11_02215 [Gemmobacter sp.]|nr:hypothetical protein [Gemmobacter sp.]